MLLQVLQYCVNLLHQYHLTNAPLAKLRNEHIINHGRWIPVGIQVVVSSLEWSIGCPVLVQESKLVFWIGGCSCIKFGYGNVRDLQLLHTGRLFFIRLEYLVK